MNKRPLSNITNISTLDDEKPNRATIGTTSTNLLPRNENAVVDYSIPPYVVPDTEIAEDIDTSDLGFQIACAAYAEDVYDYLHELEIKLKLPNNFMQIQTQINPRHRAYCSDWMVDIHRHISKAITHLEIDSLFLAISVMDRFLSKKNVSLERLNLVALASFYSACKFEERIYPVIDDLLHLIPEAGKKEDMIRMERMILNELHYSMGMPTSIVFLKRSAKAAHADAVIGMLSRFICEYSLTSYTITTTYLPSHIAAAATAHALRIVGRPPWTATLQKCTGYTYEQLRPCMLEMRKVVKHAPSLKTQAIFRKYSDMKYLEAAKIVVQRI